MASGLSQRVSVPIQAAGSRSVLPRRAAAPVSLPRRRPTGSGSRTQLTVRSAYIPPAQQAPPDAQKRLRLAGLHRWLFCTLPFLCCLDAGSMCCIQPCRPRLQHRHKHPVNKRVTTECAILPRSLELPTDDFQQAVTLTALKRKRGGTAIIVQEVEAGSASAAAGVRPGQQLLGLSDTLRSGEVWELNGAHLGRAVHVAACAEL